MHCLDEKIGLVNWKSCLPGCNWTRLFFLLSCNPIITNCTSILTEKRLKDLFSVHYATTFIITGAVASLLHFCSQLHRLAGRTKIWKDRAVWEKVLFWKLILKTHSRKYHLCFRFFFSEICFTCSGECILENVFQKSYSRKRVPKVVDNIILKIIWVQLQTIGVQKISCRINHFMLGLGYLFSNFLLHMKWGMVLLCNLVFFFLFNVTILCLLIM